MRACVRACVRRVPTYLLTYLGDVALHDGIQTAEVVLELAVHAHVHAPNTIAVIPLDLNGSYCCGHCIPIRGIIYLCPYLYLYLSIF